MSLKAQPVNRILVRGTNWVGDAVMTIPALRELRRLFPKAHITLASGSFAEELLKEADFIDEFLVHDRDSAIRSLAKQSRNWRSRKFDLAVLFPNSFEPALIAWLARIPIRIGYATQGRGFLLTNAVAVPDWKDSRHEIFYYLNLVSKMERSLFVTNSVEESPPVLDLPVGQSTLSRARFILNSAGIRKAGPLVLLCPGSINSRAKRWPAERYAALGDMLVDRLDADVVIIGSAGELDVTEEVARQMEQSPTVLTGKTCVSELVGVIATADLLITNDTGPAHIAAALNRPALVIFGPTNPLTTKPYADSGVVIRHPPDCAPCMLRDCPIDHRCMTAISPDELFEKATAILNGKAPRSREQLVAGR